jgi:hypothetical protein
VSEPQWAIVEVDGQAHIVPIGEAHDAEDCRCCPRMEDGALIHAAFDEREKFERGERKPS